MYSLSSQFGTLSGPDAFRTWSLDSTFNTHSSVTLKNSGSSSRGKHMSGSCNLYWSKGSRKAVLMALACSGLERSENYLTYQVPTLRLCAAKRFRLVPPPPGVLSLQLLYLRFIKPASLLTTFSKVSK